MGQIIRRWGQYSHVVRVDHLQTRIDISAATVFDGCWQNAGNFGWFLVGPTYDNFTNE